jgi:hypothetical protein
MSTNNPPAKKSQFLQGLASMVSASERDPDQIFFDNPDAALKQGSGDEPGGRTDGKGVPPQRRIQTPRLIEAIVEQGIATRAQVEEALEIQKKTSDKRRLIDAPGGRRRRPRSRRSPGTTRSTGRPVRHFGIKEKIDRSGSSSTGSSRPTMIRP